MAKCAESALLAAIEIYNKPTVEYREQTFSLLIVNAWEVLLKARIVQQNRNRLEAIYRRDLNGIAYARNQHGDVLTINFEAALHGAQIPRDIEGNLVGLVAIRNRVAHLGILHSDVQQRVLQYGTASVRNFIKIYEEWFGTAVRVPYLLPLGLVGAVSATPRSPNQRQRQLLERLEEIAESYSDIASPYSVAMTVEVNLNPRLIGGAAIGLTNDPNAMLMRISDDQVADHFSSTYAEIVQLCRNRYVDFKQNREFHDAMNGVKHDPTCAFLRTLNPSDPNSTGKHLYNPAATIARLDKSYKTT